MYQQTIIIGNLGSDPGVHSLAMALPLRLSVLLPIDAGITQTAARAKRRLGFVPIAGDVPAEIANEYLHKGDLIMLVGRVKSSAFPDKNTGEARASLELTVTELKLMPKDQVGIAMVKRSVVAQKTKPHPSNPQ